MTWLLKMINRLYSQQCRIGTIFTLSPSSVTYGSTNAKDVCACGITGCTHQFHPS